MEENDFYDVRLFDHYFATANEQTLNTFIFKHLASSNKKQLILAHYNLHSLFLYKRDDEMRKAMEAIKHIWIDGIPVIFILKLFGYKIPFSWRITFLDWQHSFFAQSSLTKASIFLLGSKLDNITKTEKLLSKKYPSTNFIVHHGYFDSAVSSDENKQLIKKINASKADILLVGMGMPRQELWIDKNSHKINTKIIMPIGGYFDYISGSTYTPPRWAGRVGFEWAFRLANDPKRLWHRYTVEPFYLFWYLLTDAIKKK